MKCGIFDNAKLEIEYYDTIKSFFEKQDKEKVVEYLSALLSKLIANSVSVGVPDTPDHIEYVDDNGLVQRLQGRRGSVSIRDELNIDFARHDEKVRDEFRKEFLKKCPSPPTKE